MLSHNKEVKTMREKKVTELAVEFILSRNIKDLGKLTTEKVARSISVNSFYLYLNFLIYQRITLPNFILKEKLKEAFFTLEKDKEVSIEELSKDLGFLEVQDFNLEFEKYFAIVPGKFRDIRKKSQRL